MVVVHIREKTPAAPPKGAVFKCSSRWLVMDNQDNTMAAMMMARFPCFFARRSSTKKDPRAPNPKELGSRSAMDTGEIGYIRFSFVKSTTFFYWLDTSTYSSEQTKLELVDLSSANGRVLGVAVCLVKTQRHQAYPCT